MPATASESRSITGFGFSGFEGSILKEVMIILRSERKKVREFAASMLEVLKETESRDGFVEFLIKEFPEQARKAIEDYRHFYGEI